MSPPIECHGSIIPYDMLRSAIAGAQLKKVMFTREAWLHASEEKS